MGKRKSNTENTKRTFWQENPNLTFFNMMWLFIIFSLVGVVGEGLWTLIFSGHWETHVVSMWVPLCIIYGLGAVGCYVAHCFLKNKNLIIRFVVFLVVGSVVELICGLVLEFGLHMTAWSYKGMFLNIRGHICLIMSILWGVLGVLFSYFLVKPIDKVLTKLKGETYVIISAIVATILVFDFALTGVCITRWSNRHFGVEAQNSFEKFIDETYDDSLMSERFIEWGFID